MQAAIHAAQGLAAAGSQLVGGLKELVEYERQITGVLAARRQFERYRRQLEAYVLACQNAGPCFWGILSALSCPVERTAPFHARNRVLDAYADPATNVVSGVRTYGEAFSTTSSEAASNLVRDCRVYTWSCM